jgi:hypothetical protein
MVHCGGMFGTIGALRCYRDFPDELRRLIGLPSGGEITDITAGLTDLTVFWVAPGSLRDLP